MPPKVIDEELVKLFSKIGLNETKAKEAAGNTNLSKQLKEILDESGLDFSKEVDKSVGQILYTMATKYPQNALTHRKMVISYVIKKEITSVNLQATLDYIKQQANEPVDLEQFKKSCGLGVVITPQQIKEAVLAFFSKNNNEIIAKREKFNFNGALGEIRNTLKWAESKAVKDTVDEVSKEFLSKLPPSETDKLVSTPTGSNNNNNNKDNNKKVEVEEEEEKIEDIKFPDPSENVQATPKILKDHLEKTGGKVVTRFPPEPNGYLHIGHAKAMFLDFGYAKKTGGKCYLRFDDTNPEKENHEYIDSIKDSVKWLGHEPCEITYTSQYFDQLFELAVELIKRGFAYVCFQTPTEIKEGRENKLDSPYRNTPVEENLRLFEEMRKGKFEEGKAVLRMKGDMKHDNPCMRDMIAYRIKYHHHPMTGDKWVIYPSYDFSHCLVDSMENITHSLCTLEFEIRRLTYNWLIDVLGMYRPVVWEFARLNLTHILLSKRKIIQLVKNKIVDGWDDPRLSTLNAFRRKGFTPESINTLCEMVRVTRTNNTTLPFELLEYCLRQDLNEKVTRAMVVLDPIRVVITNYPEDKDEEITVPNVPIKPEKGTHKVDFSRVVYIERSDFRMQDSKDYFGLAPNKEILLKYSYNIRCNEVITDSNGNVSELRVTYDPKNLSTKLKTIHWVSSKVNSKPLAIEARLYEHLFTEADLGDDWENHINPKSKEIIQALADKTVVGSKLYDRFQFERNGYYCVDKDSTDTKLVFNRTCSLKEDKGKLNLKKK